MLKKLSHLTFNELGSYLVPLKILVVSACFCTTHFEDLHHVLHTPLLVILNLIKKSRHSINTHLVKIFESLEHPPPSRLSECPRCSAEGGEGGWLRLDIHLIIEMWYACVCSFVGYCHAKYFFLKCKPVAMLLLLKSSHSTIFINTKREMSTFKI